MRKVERADKNRLWTGKPSHQGDRDLERRRIYIPDAGIRGDMLSAEIGTIIKTIDYTAANTQAIMVDASSGDISISLPAASVSTNKIYTIMKTDESTHTVLIEPAGDDTINGQQSITLTLQYQYVTIVCEGTGWFIIGGEYVQIAEVLNSILDTLERQEELLEHILEEERD